MLQCRQNSSLYTRMGIKTYNAGAFSSLRISVGAPASAKWTSTLSLSIWPRMSLRYAALKPISNPSELYSAGTSSVAVPLSGEVTVRTTLSFSSPILTARVFSVAMVATRSTPSCASARDERPQRRPRVAAARHDPRLDRVEGGRDLCANKAVSRAHNSSLSHFSARTRP